MTLPDRVITAEELAELLGVTKRWVMERCREGDWPHWRLGRACRFSPDHVRQIFALLERRAKPKTAPPTTSRTSKAANAGLSDRAVAHLRRRRRHPAA